MTRFNIMVVEDNVSFGNTIIQTLNDCGFDATHVENSDQTLSHMMIAQRPPDVVILDMNLGRGKNGVQVGEQIRKLFGSKSPEFIVCSAYSDVEFLRGALSLEVAVYLDKLEHNLLNKLVSYCRVLCFRKYLRLNRTQHENIFGQICVSSPNVAKAIERTAVEFLMPLMVEQLGASFLMMFSMGDQTWNFGAPLPLVAPELPISLAQTQVFAQNTVIRGKTLLENSNELDKGLALERAAFIPLYQCSELNIALAIYELPRSHFPKDGLGFMPEDTYILAQNIERFLRTYLVEHIFSVAHLRARMEQSGRILRTTVARFLRYMGEYQVLLLQRAISLGEVSPNAAILGQLEQIGHEVQNFGKLLEPKPHSEKAVGIDLNAMLRDTLEDMKQAKTGNEMELGVIGDSRPNSKPAQLYIAIKKTMYFLASRQVNNHVTVTLRDMDPWILIEFHDRSTRLSEDEIRELFVPFAKPLDWSDMVQNLNIFVAKTLVEGELNGTLGIHNDESPGSKGNLIRLMLPLSHEGGQA